MNWPRCSKESTTPTVWLSQPPPPPFCGCFFPLFFVVSVEKPPLVFFWESQQDYGYCLVVPRSPVSHKHPHVFDFSLLRSHHTRNHPSFFFSIVLVIQLALFAAILPFFLSAPPGGSSLPPFPPACGLPFLEPRQPWAFRFKVHALVLFTPFLRHSRIRVHFLKR